MTASTPPLVDVIAEVLAYEHCKRVNPKADHPIMGYHTFHTDQREHLRGVQMDVARAVLAALEQAGGVEWGVLAAGQERPYTYDSEDAASDDAKCACCTLVSRIIGPWERAE